MYRISYFAGVVVATLSLSGARAESPSDKTASVVIPLDAIWANDMPGTRDIDTLVQEPPLTYLIRQAIGFAPKVKAKPAFAVRGMGLDALGEAHEVLVGKQRRRGTLPSGADISIVFFAHETGPYVHLQKVERQGNNIDIQYHFIPHDSKETMRYVALIPLGKLNAGAYRVKINKSPMEQKYLDLGFRPVSDADSSRIVSRPFSFTVSEQGE
jgi:hypothetical protein